MKNKYLYITWAVMYLLCALLGFLPHPQGAVYWLLFLISVMFFIPPAVILYQAIHHDDKKHVRIVRNLSIAWLCVMLVMLVVNLLSIGSSRAVGTALYYMLVVLASPMICAQIWVAPMFGFGCLLTASIQHLRKKKTGGQHR